MYGIGILDQMARKYSAKASTHIPNSTKTGLRVLQHF